MWDDIKTWTFNNVVNPTLDVIESGSKVISGTLNKVLPGLGNWANLEHYDARKKNVDDQNVHNPANQESAGFFSVLSWLPYIVVFGALGWVVMKLKLFNLIKRRKRI